MGLLALYCCFVASNKDVSFQTEKKNDEHRQFQERWTLQYFFVEFNGNATCLICKEKVAVPKEYNLKCHYWTKHGEQYENYQGDERKK